ncbi:MULTISPECIES: transcription elongation factor GreA [Holospora]|uniref:Transcription elongation factor GreA n=2 Tax=Holospora TaxID=44747 RepID=A0A061JFS4_9PROT|nr:transcription elongation factor GreA [Holospora elegans]ETZ04556.1 transcription elongation factor GreA [Holospora undulata HU1]GAJ46471.1 transcription elongation factor GreA [Holospora elegans E1]
MTERGLRQLQDELRNLTFVERPQVIAEIAKARSYGDLSENAEYAAAKEKQHLVERRIRYIEERISRAQVVDLRTLSGNKVFFGAYVVLEDEEREVQYQIVGADEADIKQGKLSIEAPLAKALIGKEVGDYVVLTIVQKEKQFLIKSVQYSCDTD